MNLDEGKKIYASHQEAEQAAKSLRTKLNKNFAVYPTSGGWAVGGVHVNAKQPYKRVKSLLDIKALFDHLDEPVDDPEIERYAALIESESRTEKFSETNGDGEGWVLQSCSIKTGRELMMSNDNPYLVLRVKNNTDTLDIQMGGAFSPSIPLVSKQAQSLLDRAIVWHTWNSRANPAIWSRSKWFYMIEPA